MPVAFRKTEVRSTSRGGATGAQALSSAPKKMTPFPGSHFSLIVGMHFLASKQYLPFTVGAIFQFSDVLVCQHSNSNRKF